MNSATSQAAGKSDSELSLIKLLVVDDDQIDRERVRRMLSKSKLAEYQIDEADNFAQAVALLEDNSYTSCLLDYNLGGRTGIELLETIHKISPSSAIIVLTGQEEEALANEAMEAGASDFLNKAELTATLLARTIRYCIHHKKIGEERDFLAHHDALTGLVNRSLFFNRLNHKREKSLRKNAFSAILYLDIDAFKSINDQYGHEFGDCVLQQLAERLLSCVRSCDTVARLGGDEFVVLVEDIDKANAHKVCQNILKKLDAPFAINGINLYVTISIGMTCFNSSDLSANQLLLQADNALYTAKREGKKTYRNYNETMQKTTDALLGLEHDFILALKAGLITPYYQPKYCPKSGKIKSFEVLARWFDKEKGMIGPDKFIPCAEKLMVMSEFTAQILNKACADFQIIKSKFCDVTLSINVSATTCSSPTLIRMLDHAISTYKLQRSELEIEVTETALMKDQKKSVEILRSINDSGIRIAIDDFGKGYSSLSYLTELPIDTLKIDMDFVQGIGVSPQKESVVQVIIDLSKRLGVEVVAEGVETAAQLGFLKDHDVDLVQGYYFSPAVSLEDCLKLKN